MSSSFSKYIYTILKASLTPQNKGERKNDIVISKNMRIVNFLAISLIVAGEEAI